MAEIIIPLVLAILQGKESESSLKLSHALVVQFYDRAYHLYINNYVAIPKGKLYKAVQHNPTWTRRTH